MTGSCLASWTGCWSLWSDLQVAGWPPGPVSVGGGPFPWAGCCGRWVRVLSPYVVWPWSVCTFSLCPVRGLSFHPHLPKATASAAAALAPEPCSCETRSPLAQPRLPPTLLVRLPLAPCLWLLRSSPGSASWRPPPTPRFLPAPLAFRGIFVGFYLLFLCVCRRGLSGFSCVLQRARAGSPERIWPSVMFLCKMEPKSVC